jgi:predicted nucleic acid-binding protein
MKKMRIYLDTSVVNFLFADDSPDFRRVTEEFFALYAGLNDLYGSDVVLRELSRDPVSGRREQNLRMLVKHHVEILPMDRDIEVVRLAEEYLRQGIIPLRKRDDALHVAYATVFEMDVLLSWNFKHLANLRREARLSTVNQAEGYWRSPRIVSPLEVEDEREE